MKCNSKKVIICLAVMLAASQIAGPYRACAQYYPFDTSWKGPGTQVSRTLTVPAAVLKQVPRGGDSRFYGTLPLRFHNRPVTLHVYGTSPPHGQPRMDLYTRVGTGHHSTLHRFSRVVLDVRGAVFDPYGGGGYSTVWVRALWLDPKTRRIPVVDVALSIDPRVEPIGADALVVFPAGLSSKAVVQGFAFGRSNVYEGSGWSFGDVDKQGLLTIRTSDWVKSETTTTVYGWDGERFVPGESKTVDRGG